MERPNDQRHRMRARTRDGRQARTRSGVAGFFDKMRESIARAAGLLKGTKLSAREGDLTVDVFAVKRKLGASFFTRQLNRRTRARRIASLTPKERQIAVDYGWLPARRVS